MIKIIQINSQIQVSNSQIYKASFSKRNLIEKQEKKVKRQFKKN